MILPTPSGVGIVQGRKGGLSGHVAIVCRSDETGRTYLASQSTRAPFHLSKPYWDGRTLGVQLVNTTAGLLSGDRLSCSVEVESAARLSITTPSATRIFSMERDRAEVTQHFCVAKSASLIYMPSQLVPHRQSRYRQATRIVVEEGGELCFIDSLAPGRVAHGEFAQFEELDFQTELEYRRRLVIRERYTLQGNSASAAYFYACAYFVTARLDDKSPCWSQISALHSAENWVGVTEPAPGVWIVKVLGRSSMALRSLLLQIRAILEPVFPFANLSSRMPF